MTSTIDRSHANRNSATGSNHPRRGLSRLARIGFTLAVVAPALLWAEPAAARIAVNHNEAVGEDQRA